MRLLTRLTLHLHHRRSVAPGCFSGRACPFSTAVLSSSSSSSTSSSAAHIIASDAFLSQGFAYLEKEDIHVSSEQLELLSRYGALFLEANQRGRLNLSAHRDLQSIWRKHIFDSLTIRPVLDQLIRELAAPSTPSSSSIPSSSLSSPLSPLPPSSSPIWSQSLAASTARPLRIADVGSGGGAPGLIFAISRPDVQITLIDSTLKKCTFLRNTVEALGLRNVQVQWARVEDLCQSAATASKLVPAPDRAPSSITFRESFDICIARSVAEMRILSELCLPLLRVGGHFAAMKLIPDGTCDVAARDVPAFREGNRERWRGSVELREAHKAVSVLGGSWPPLIYPTDLIKEDEEEKVVDNRQGKCLVVVRKVKSTPPHLPRISPVLMQHPL